MLAEPLYLQGCAGPCIAFFEDSRIQTRSDTAVLFCPPFGWDDMCSYRGRRDWAVQLAELGCPSLRFDLPGTGDSAGSPHDPGLLDVWTDTVERAASWLAGRVGRKRIAAIGIGLGGMLAWRAVAVAQAPIDDLVLWATPARGRTLVRELRAFSALEIARTVEPEPDGRAGEPFAANGYSISDETLRELNQLDLSELSLPRAHGRRILLLERDKLGVDSRLEQAAQSSGAIVEVAPGNGYAALMIEPQESRPPRETFAVVADWLARRDAPAPQRDVTVSASPEANAVAQMRAGEAIVVEEPLRVRQGFGDLSGVLARSRGAEVGLTVVLLNAGPQRRIGPNRMWTEAARRWAASGIATARMDLAGIGDADGDASRFTDVAQLYTDEFLGQVQATLDELERRGLPNRFVLMGLCAGAYWSAHVAAQDKRVLAAFLLNPRALIWDEWTVTARRTRTLMKLATKGSTWRRVVAGDITPSKHIATAGALMRRAASTPERIIVRARSSLASGDSRADKQHGDALHRLLGGLAAREVSVLLLFTGAEPLREELARQGRLEAIARLPNVRVEIRGNAADTHTLAPLWLQHEIHELIDEALSEVTARLRTGTGVSTEGPLA